MHGDIRRKLRQIDYTGSILLLAASVLILLPVSWGGSLYAWDSAGVLAPLVVSQTCTSVIAGLIVSKTGKVCGPDDPGGTPCGLLALAC